MIWSEALDSRYVNSELLGEVGTEKVVTITKVEKDAEFYSQQKGKTERGLAIHFKEVRPLIANVTNTKTLMRLFGGANEDVSASYGKKVILKVEETKVAGKMRPCIRIKEFSEIPCEECGEVILPASGKSVSDLVEISKRNCNGKTLCVSCMRKYKEEAENSVK